MPDENPGTERERATGSGGFSFTSAFDDRPRRGMSRARRLDQRRLLGVRANFSEDLRRRHTWQERSNSLMRYP